MNFLLRTLLIIAGLIFAASLMIVTLVLLVLWGVRAIWCKLTGRPLVPFAFALNPRAGFEQMYKKAQSRSDNSAKQQRRKLDDVTDVEPKR